MLNENLTAILATILCILIFINNPKDADIVIIVITNFLAFIGGKNYQGRKDNNNKVKIRLDEIEKDMKKWNKYEN